MLTEGSVGGRMLSRWRNKKLSKKRRVEIAQRAARARWDRRKAEGAAA